MAMLSRPPIPLKMYKHFAVVTLAMTATVAMFADDGERTAREEQEAAERLASERSGDRGDPGEAEFVIADGVGPEPSFNSESTVSPAASGWGGVSGGSTSGGRSRGRAMGSGRISIPGHDQTIINGLSEEDYRRLVATLPPEMRNPAASRDAAIRASAQRSGRGGQSADAPG